MTDDVLQVSKKALVSLLKELPQEILDEIVGEIKQKRGKALIKAVPFKEVLKLKRIISVGGDSVKETEGLYG